MITGIISRMEKIKTNLRKNKMGKLNDLRLYVDDLLIKRVNEHQSSYVFVL